MARRSPGFVIDNQTVAVRIRWISTHFIHPEPIVLGVEEMRKGPSVPILVHFAPSDWLQTAEDTIQLRAERQGH